MNEIDKQAAADKLSNAVAIAVLEYVRATDELVLEMTYTHEAKQAPTVSMKTVPREALKAFSKKPLVGTGLALRIDQPGPGGMMFTPEVVARVAEQLQKDVAHRTQIVGLGPPQVNECGVSLAEVCGVLVGTEVTAEGLKCSVEAIDTPPGRIFRQLLKQSKPWYLTCLAEAKVEDIEFRDDGTKLIRDFTFHGFKIMHDESNLLETNLKEKEE